MDTFEGLVVISREEKKRNRADQPDIKDRQCTSSISSFRLQITKWYKSTTKIGPQTLTIKVIFLLNCTVCD